MTQDICVYKGYIANYLLGKGYRIVSVASNKKKKGLTVFYFKRDAGIEDEIKNALDALDPYKKVIVAQINNRYEAYNDTGKFLGFGESYSEAYAKGYEILSSEKGL